MNIKPSKASTRDYRKGYLMGGGVDPKHPELGVQGASEWYQPAQGATQNYKGVEVPTGAGELGSLGTMSFSADGPDAMFHKRKK